MLNNIYLRYAGVDTVPETNAVRVRFELFGPGVGIMDPISIRIEPIAGKSMLSQVAMAHRDLAGQMRIWADKLEADSAVLDGTSGG